MRWIPPWLARPYARLYKALGTKEFDYSKAGPIIDLEDKRLIATTLTKLRIFGYLTVRRDPVDPRRKLFRLIDPESIVLAMSIQSEAKVDDVIGKLRSASGSLDYYLNGAYAAYQYHRYSAPGRMDLSVRAAQLSTWVALLSGRGVSLSIDDIPAEKPAENNIHLRSDFDEKLSEHVRVINEIRYLSPEMLIVLGIAKANPSMEDVLALLVVQRKKLDWRGLLEVAEAYDATRFLGCILDVLNFESRRPPYESNLIRKMFKQSNLEARLDFPVSMRSQPTEKLYDPLASKWNLRLHLTHALVTKILTDLMRQ
jgi:hypothetical protein